LNIGHGDRPVCIFGSLDLPPTNNTIKDPGSVLTQMGVYILTESAEKNMQAGKKA